MRFSYKILLNCVIVAAVLILFYEYQINDRKLSTIVVTENLKLVKQYIENGTSDKLYATKHTETSVELLTQKVHFSDTYEEYNVWCIFTKVYNNSPMKRKFERFATSLVKHTSVFLKLHLIIDSQSKIYAQEVLKSVKNFTNKTMFAEFYYEVDHLAKNLRDIISSMQPYFSSQPGSYYSDVLFFLSLGLHRIAEEQKRAIMFDADTKLLTDVAELFQEFERFSSTTLFGLAPELSPVYRHILYSFRLENKNTAFGDPVEQGGYPGVNSGVIMFQFENIRRSEKYDDLLKPESVKNLTSKYNFKGHLGDQDFYTLLGMEHPLMIYILGCEWNRQLCTWWKNHGYQDIFDDFFRCEKEIKIFHGNCNTAIPNSNVYPP